jgi:hypothetical protein
MSTRIVNLSNGHRYKFNQAKRLVEQQCALAWVQYGVSVRELTVEEMVKARSEQIRLQEPLPYAEVHGLRYDPSASGIEASRRERGLIWEAHDFLRSVAA